MALSRETCGDPVCGPQDRDRCGESRTSQRRRLYPRGCRVCAPPTVTGLFVDRDWLKPVPTVTGLVVEPVPTATGLFGRDWHVCSEFARWVATHKSMPSIASSRMSVVCPPEREGTTYILQRLKIAQVKDKIWPWLAYLFRVRAAAVGRHAQGR